MRKIIHIDMDAFFASVEQRDTPSFKDKPLIVGGDPNSRGVVAACSYEARKYGIHSAMVCSKAYRLCPHAIFVRPRIQHYKAVSNQIYKIFRRYTDRVEPLSLDEAYLDVTGLSHYEGSATLMAKAICGEIYNETGLTASAGVSYNKFLAKLASDINKPNGMHVVLPDQAQKLLRALPVRAFFGIGRVTEQRLKRLGIYDGKGLEQCSKAFLEAHFGRAGSYYYDVARGIDHRVVESKGVRKSLGREKTFDKDKSNVSELLQNVSDLNEHVFQMLARQKLIAQTITLKLRYDDFETITRSYTDSIGFSSLAQGAQCLSELLGRTEAGKRNVRLIGVTYSKFLHEKPNQLLLDTTL